MTQPKTTGKQQPASKPEDGQEAGEQEIDLEALAEKVFELLKDEARVERERTGRGRG